MSTRLADFARRRRQGAQALDALAQAAAQVGDDAGAERLSALAQRAREGRFVVLLLGCFSSGKSTLLNALLGRPALPVKVNPCTAILTEVVFGAQPSVQVKMRDGSSQQLGIEAFLEQYQLRTTSEADAGGEVSDRFGQVDRAVLAYPTPLLDNGVVLLDTPGLDDDPARTQRTLASLPHADAVIVVLNATRFLTQLERRTLRRSLLPLGLTNLFFPVTMVDLLDALSDDPAADLAALHARARRELGPLCQVAGQDRFAERFFPLDARGGLRARWDRGAGRAREPVDQAALDASGVPPFEASLEHFLVAERGQAQLRHLVTVARGLRDDLLRQAELDRATADASVETLRARHEELEPQFRALEAIAARVARSVDGFVARQQVLVFRDLRDFLISCEADLPDAVDGFDLGGLAGLDLVTAQGRGRVEARIRRELEAWLDARLSQWQRGLRPRIEEALVQLRREIAGEARDFDALVSQIVQDFSGGLSLPPSQLEDPEVDPVERWFAVAVGAVMLSPGAMAAGWSEGYEGALKGAASRIGVRLALVAIGALLGPVGWVSLALYAISDAVLLVLTGGSQLKRLRDQVAFNLQGKLVAQADAAKGDIEARVVQGMSPLRDALVGAAREEADAVRQLLDSTLQARSFAASEAAERAEQWARSLAVVTERVAELEELAG